MGEIENQVILVKQELIKLQKMFDNKAEKMAFNLNMNIPRSDTRRVINSANTTKVLLNNEFHNNRNDETQNNAELFIAARIADKY